MEIIILTFLFVTKGLKLPKRQPEVVNRRINNTMGKRKRTNNDLQNKYWATRTPLHVLCKEQILHH